MNAEVEKAAQEKRRAEFSARWNKLCDEFIPMLQGISPPIESFDEPRPEPVKISKPRRKVGPAPTPCKKNATAGDSPRRSWRTPHPMLNDATSDSAPCSSRRQSLEPTTPQEQQRVQGLSDVEHVRALLYRRANWDEPELTLAQLQWLENNSSATQVELLVSFLM